MSARITQYDVFIIQGTGRRRWRVGEKLNGSSTVRTRICYRSIRSKRLHIDEKLEPGDILLHRHVFPHEGYALENAMNYSVGFRAPNTRELISGFADYVLQRELGGNYYSDSGCSTSRSSCGRSARKRWINPREMMLESINQPEHFKNGW
ncbi:cupin domain-containing protein [Escherichia coli]